MPCPGLELRHAADELHGLTAPELQAPLSLAVGPAPLKRLVDDVEARCGDGTLLARPRVDERNHAIEERKEALAESLL